jgi:hypothetical protein
LFLYRIPVVVASAEKNVACSDGAKANPRKKLFALTEQRQIQEKSCLL